MVNRRCAACRQCRRLAIVSCITPPDGAETGVAPNDHGLRERAKGATVTRAGVEHPGGPEGARRYPRGFASACPVARAPAAALRHALSVDVEDWYHDSAGAAPAVAGSRVEANTLRLLDILAAHGAGATFFFLGDVAARFPTLARRVAAAGHEVGSHGDSHRRVMQMTRREFREDVARSVRVIEDAIGAPVHGYRAPYFSIKADVRWPIEILAELGLRYDASILAIDRPPGLELVCARTPFRHPNGLWEVPVAVLQMLHFWYLPLASGSGLRLLPRWLFERTLRKFEREIGLGVFYLHPWELDPASPVGQGAGRWLIRAGRGGLEARLGALLRDRRFAPITAVFGERIGFP
jgi:polysaccharide deacetylase family protein (PEP-CTERM system associated)